MNSQLNKKNIFLIAVFVLFAILLSFMIFKYYNSQKNNSEIIKSNQEKNNDIKIEDEEEGKPKIKNNLQTKEERLEDANNFSLATEQNEPEKCESINDEGTKNLCYKRIATKTNDISYCDKLFKDDQLTCEFGIYKSLAREEKSVDPCLELGEDYLVKKCINDVLDSNYCSDDECYNEFLNNIDDYDSDGDGIIDDKETYIYKTDKDKIDTDKDGLTDYEEIFKYKTNPKLPDTDSDGYGDGVEVKSGYDPLN